MAKKLFALMMVLIMACSCFVYAEEAVLDGTTEEIQGDVMLISAEADQTPVAEAPAADKAKVVFEASEPDADGFFTVDMTAYNFEFMVMQAYITYNPEAVVPVNAETKAEAEAFSDFAKLDVTAEKDGKELTDVFTTTWTQLLKDKSAFSFSFFANMSKYPNSIVNENKRIVADTDGLELFSFSFKKISDKDADFKIYNSTRSTEVDGVKISNIVEDEITVKTVVILPEAVSNTGIFEADYVVKPDVTTSNDSADAKESMDQRVKNRSKNVIFLQIGNYGTVSDSVLKWVDKDNKDVKPYIKDDRTMVPLRFIAEELGATVAYEMDCAAEIVADRTFVPVRFVTEALGKSVEWLNAQRMVIITNKTYPWDNENGVEKRLMSEIMLMLTLRDYAYPNAQ